MLNISCVQIKTYRFPLDIYKGFSIRYVFGGNSSVVSISNGMEGVGSEHWIFENSDRLLFCESGNLVGLELSVPGSNAKSVPEVSRSYWGEMVFKDPKHFVLGPALFRSFSAERRELTCLGSICVGGVDCVYIKDDFSFLFSNGRYCGYRLKNPMRYFCESADENLELIVEPDENEYLLMEKYFSIMSDDKLEELGQDMGLLIVELDKEISPRLMDISCVRRRTVIEKAIADLRDFYS